MSEIKIQASTKQNSLRSSHGIRSLRREVRHNLIWNYEEITHEVVFTLFDEMWELAMNFCPELKRTAIQLKKNI